MLSILVLHAAECSDDGGWSAGSLWQHFQHSGADKVGQMVVFYSLFLGEHAPLEIAPVSE